MFRFLLLMLMLGAAVGGGVYYRQFFGHDAQQPNYRTEKVERGEIHITVDATGTVEPEEVVDIGAQVTGRVKEFGKDPRGKDDPKFADKHIDYGSPVEKGMLLAQIDPSTYLAQQQQAQASLAQATANVAQMEAQVMQTRAEWERAEKLKDLKISSRSPTGDASTTQAMPIKGISDADYVLAQANAESAIANRDAAKATVLQAEASLTLANTNLGYTTIISPIDGTIIDRRMNIGQTAVSNLNATSMFLLARDLHRMEVWTAVNEADIARIKPGTKANFTVDALPEDIFHGEVTQIRLNASMTQNVVIYTVVVSVENPDLKLYPYMTATVHFEVDDRTDSLLVPNASLRYRPSPEQIFADPAAGNSDAGGPASRGNRRPRGGPGTAKAGRVWLIAADGEKLRPVDVQIGLADRAFTEITGGELREGDEIVVGEARAAAGDTAGGEVTNPFAPPRFGGRRPR
jgi:HlyD family secretion protein